MPKKIIRDILIIAGLFAMWASTSRVAMEYISDKRSTDTALKSWWGEYPGRYGDLVKFAYLDKVEKFHSKKNYVFKRPVYNSNKNVVLYISGDSYTDKIPDSAYAGLYAYKYGRRFRKNLEYALDTAKQNLLIIQIAERYTRDYFKDTRIFQDVPKAAPDHGSPVAQETSHSMSYSDALAFLNPNNFFNKNINQNLQYNLFNYNFIVPVMMYKALFNYALFDRASGDVVISSNKQQLFYKETVTANDISSSYSPLPAADVTKIIDNLNAIYDHYKGDGFKEVYLSIIPSTATIMQPEWYNRFIPIIQNDPRLKMKVIDVYSTFSTSSEMYFLPGDVHWNNNGMQVWLCQVNKMLEGWNKDR